jgi:PhzF family phenazine biosynthesis protein
MTVEVLRYSAFTRDGSGGNPAGVVLDAGSLTDADMLSIAADLGYSETAFVLSDDLGRVRLRYFSPLAEVAFCGHATIATAVALAERDGTGRLELTTMAGAVGVETEPGPEGITATLTSPPAHSRPVDPEVLERSLAALRWTADDLDERFPVHVGFAGNQHLVIGVRDEPTLAALDYDYDALAALMAEQGWTTVHAFWSASTSVFHARDPFPPGGVVEDPATGAAAAAFGGYLRTTGLVAVPSRFTILQGHHMGSPSRLLVDLDADTESVRVSGTATLLAR